MNTDNLIQNMISAAKLDVNFFNAVEHDESKNQEALTVVVIAAIAAGIGALLTAIIGKMFMGILNNLADVQAHISIGSIILSTLWAAVYTVIGYYLWSFIVYWVGTNIFEGEADFGEVKRTIGYAYSPQILSFFRFIPCLGFLLTVAGIIWSAVASFFAIREALDLDSTKTIITIVVGLVVTLIIFFLGNMLIGGVNLLANGIPS